MAEMPAGMILLFIGLGIPLIIMASVAYRAVLLHFGTRDCAIKGARQNTFTKAQTTATTTFSRDINAFTGISGTENLVVVVKPLAGGPSTAQAGPLPANSVDKSKFLYFLRATATGQVEPLTWCKNGWMGMNVPGLTGPFPLTITSEAYVENPDGLTQ